MPQFNQDKPLGGILGSTAELRVLDLLLSMPRTPYNVSELARAARVARETCDRVVKHLVGWRLLSVIESRGNVTSFGLNSQSPHIEALREFHLATLFPRDSEVQRAGVFSALSSMEEGRLSANVAGYNLVPSSQGGGTNHWIAVPLAGSTKRSGSSPWGLRSQVDPQQEAANVAAA